MKKFAPRDIGIETCKALVIDANPTSRSILMAMLREMGIGTVTAASRALDARKHLEHRVYDVVLCDYHFDRTEYSGQELLDELRRAHLLPYSTVFIMVTGEATYAKVAEAAESALDGYLLKPHNAVTLGDRVHRARARKAALRDIFDRIESEDFNAAADLCIARFHARSTYWLYAARIGAELLLRLNRHDDARTLFEAVTETQALPWSRLGIARAQVDAGQLPMARRTLESLMVDEPSFADAYDVMGRVQVEQGDLEDALVTYRKATALTPSSIGRLQKQGMLCFFTGKTDESAQLLERAVSIGITSKMFDYQSLLMLALLHFDRRDTKGLHRCHDDMQAIHAKVPGSDRLRRFARIVQTFRDLQARQPAQVVVAIKEQAEEIRSPGFDFEAACNMMAMLTRVHMSEIQLDDAQLWIAAVARRFCVSKATAELLTRACASCPTYAGILVDEQQLLTASIESAMAHSLDKRPGDSVKALLQQGAETLNGKIIDMAGLVLQRHGTRIANAATLAAELAPLQQHFGGSGVQAQIGTTNGRQPGAIVLRAAPTDRAAMPVAVPATALAAHVASAALPAS